ncbi:MAG: asparaginase [Oscillospiraceae bacterium]|nr:asparaginase [Oscillospiraceae bacterium]
MKIMVALTGGTIGSTAINNNINVNINIMPEIVDRYCEKYKNDIGFTIISAMSVLSENITYSEWNLLIKTLANVDLDGFDGIIVTHGTDTLPYTAALLGFVFGNSEIPIILVSSNKPLDVEGSNGFRNFASAVTLIKEKVNGVYATVGYDDTEYVYSATSLMESDGYNDRFSDFSGQEYGIVQNDSFFINKNFNCIHERNLSISKDIELINEILFISPYPNINYDIINLENKPRAILHSLYHSGTACVVGKNKSLVNFIKKCTALDIDFYVAPFKSGDVQYSTANDILHAGAVVLCNISTIAAYVKLCLLYNAKNLNPKSDMLKPIYNEFFK